MGKAIIQTSESLRYRDNQVFLSLSIRPFRPMQLSLALEFVLYLGHKF